MRIFAIFISLAGFSITANAFAATSDLASDEVALIGRWQQGLTADLRSMPLKKQSILTAGDVLDFTADHAFRLYPKCGREKAAWEKRGVSYLGGTWKITAANKLHIVMEAMGKKLERDVDFAVKGDDLTFISASNPNEQFGKFTGPVPQQCPAN
jgi:hypothetical protein